MDIVIESLYPEFSNQGGDNGNMMYLRASVPQAEFIETHFTDEPAFVTRDVSMIYMGYMTASEQEKVAARLMPYRDRLRELADAGCVILFTGNAAELLGTSIETDNGRTFAGLDLFDFTTKQDFSERLVEVYLGSMPREGAEDLDVVGYKIQFTQMQGDNEDCFFARNRVGFGLDKRSALEGFRRNNLMATWLCGPLLPLNPLFTEYIMGLLGAPGSAAFRDESLAAFEKRVEEFQTPGIKMPI